MNRGFYIRSRSVKSCTSGVTFLFLFPDSHRNRAWLALVQWHTYRSRMKLCLIEEIIQHGSFTSSSPCTHPSTMPFHYLHPMYEERRRNLTPAQTSTHVVRTEPHATNPTYLPDNLEDPSTTYVPAFARRRTNPWRTHLDRTIAQARDVTVTDALRPASSQISTTFGSGSQVFHSKTYSSPLLEITSILLRCSHYQLLNSICLLYLYSPQISVTPIPISDLHNPESGPFRLGPPSTHSSSIFHLGAFPLPWQPHEVS